MEHFGLSQGKSARAVAYARAMALCFSELVWPTRCAVCDAAGDILCETCQAQLDIIDYWQACPHCGAPWGAHQCTECNPVALADTGYTTLPFAGLVCALRFDTRSARIVRTYKDGGERRLAGVIAVYLARIIPPEWMQGSIVTGIPATAAAKRRRGFDHAADIARIVADLIGLAFVPLLLPARVHDQRKFARAERLTNLAGAFDVCFTAQKEPPARVIVIDDVVTTGATLIAAAQALVDAGVSTVYCAAFARVY